MSVLQYWGPVVGALQESADILVLRSGLNIRTKSSDPHSSLPCREGTGARSPSFEPALALVVPKVHTTASNFEHVADPMNSSSAEQSGS